MNNCNSNIVDKRDTSNENCSNYLSNYNMSCRTVGSKNENILTKILNRERSTYLNTNIEQKSHQKAFSEIPSDLQFCLKEIVPYCFLECHIFLGLTKNGQFMISYKRICENDGTFINYDFNSGYKYELFLWIYRPHRPLTKYFIVNLFDDHGVDEIKYVTVTQWSNSSDTLIIHGSSELDEMHSFISLVRLPKLGCLQCKKLQDETDCINYDNLCIKCCLVIHTKYRYNESIQKFDPKIHLNCPGFIVMCENSLIHTLKIDLNVSSKRNTGSNVINSKYVRNFKQQHDPKKWKNETKCIKRLQMYPQILVNKIDKVMMSNKTEKKTIIENRSTTERLSIVEQIMADFSDYDSETAINGSNSEITKCIDEIRHDNMDGKPSSSSHGINHLISECSIPSKGVSAYEFSEDTEKCEKLSTFRKKRLAEKKYEFNEDNIENIVPFNRMRRLMDSSGSIRNVRYSYVSQSNRTHHHMLSPTHRKSVNYLNRTSCNLASQSPTMPASGFRNNFWNYNVTNSCYTNDIQKYFSNIINRLKERSSSEMNEISTDETTNETNNSIFSKKIETVYVEEDDAHSVITNEEDDCISPGYHTSLPMEVHGSCYNNMQMISRSSLFRLKSFHSKVTITQNSFDIEAFSIHIAKYLCKLNNKKYGILFDLAFELLYVCPISCVLTATLILQFTATDLDMLSLCHNCCNDSECFAHRKLYESMVMFTWDMNCDNWNVLEYGIMMQLSPKYKQNYHSSGSNQTTLLKKLQKCMKNKFINVLCDKESTTKNVPLPYNHNNNFEHLRILDSNEDKTKESIIDYVNGIEFYRRQPYDTPSSVSSMHHSFDSQSLSSEESASESMDDTDIQYILPNRN